MTIPLPTPRSPSPHMFHRADCDVPRSSSTPLRSLLFVFPYSRSQSYSLPVLVHSLIHTDIYFVNARTILAAMCRKKMEAMNDSERTTTTNGSLLRVSLNLRSDPHIPWSSPECLWHTGHMNTGHDRRHTTAIAVGFGGYHSHFKSSLSGIGIELQHGITTSSRTGRTG